MDPKILWPMIFGLIGGLGIFLLGMKNMSEGMQAVAGTGLRRMIGLATNNRFLATGVGVLVTCLVQSSSITTVMVVGFVNGGLMSMCEFNANGHRDEYYRLMTSPREDHAELAEPLPRGC